MARPRRAKTAARKPKKTSSKTASSNQDFDLVEKLERPVGRVFQWVPSDRPIKPGWRFVPFLRYWKLPPHLELDGHITIDGLVLVETSVEQSRAELDGPRKLAENWAESAKAGSSMVIMPQEWMAEEKRTPEEWEKLNFEGDTIDIEVPLTVRIPRRWADAAVTCKLDFTEYVRRRLLIDRPVLGSMAYPWDGPVVYEPVNLSFTPVQHPIARETD